MKRFLCMFLLSIMILAIGCILPVAAEDKPVVDLQTKFGLGGELVITEVLSNNKCDNGGKTIGNDYCEYLEVMNISVKEIDLYDYFIWYNDNTRGNYFFCEPGEWKLKPGEVGLVITFFSDHAGLIVTNGDSTEPWVKYATDASGNVTFTHNTAAWLDFARAYYSWGVNVPETSKIKVFYMDRTDSTGANNGNKYTMATGFNCGNTGPITYYVSHRGDDFSKAYCSAKVMSASNNRATTFGAPAAGSTELTVFEFDYADPTPGYLNADQYDQWYGAAAGGTEAPETTTAAPVTTKAPINTTAPVTTKAPVTTPAPVVTTAAVTTTTTAETTKAPETTAPANDGCKSVIAASSVLMITTFVISAATVISKKKKFN